MSRSNDTPHSMARYSVIIFIFLLSAKLLNFVKKILIGRLFGVGDTADAFFAASYLPYYLAIFFEGAIFLAFLPAFAAIRSKEGEPGEKRFVGQMFFVFAGLCAGLIILLNVFAGPIITELVPGFRPQKMELVLPLFHIMTLVIFFISLCIFFQVLNSYHRHYVAAASSGFVDTAGMILVTVVSWKVWGIYGAAWGSVLGSLMAFASQMIFYFRTRRFFPKPLFQMSVILPCLAGLIPLASVWVFQQIPLLVLTRFGSGMWQGTISALNIAIGLITVPMALVNRTVLLSIFPFLVKQANEESSESAGLTFFNTLRASFVLLVPAGILLSVLAKPVTVLFFSGGGIDPEGTKRIALSLMWFGWGLFVFYADLFASQSLIAMRSFRPALWLSILRAALSYSICYYFSTWWDYQGIALGFSTALALNFFFFFPLCFRLCRFATEWKSFFIFTAKLWLAAVPLLAAGFFFNRIDVLTWLQCDRRVLLAGVAAAGMLLCFCYGFGLFFLRVSEFNMILEKIKGWMMRNKKLESPHA